MLPLLDDFSELSFLCFSFEVEPDLLLFDVDDSVLDCGCLDNSVDDSVLDCGCLDNSVDDSVLDCGCLDNSVDDSVLDCGCLDNSVDDSGTGLWLFG